MVVLKNTFFDMKYNFAYRCMHTLFCVDSSDVEQIENEIIATVPAMFNTTLNFFLEPIDPHQNRLFKEILRKQLHSCCLRCHYKKCRYL